MQQFLRVLLMFFVVAVQVKAETQYLPTSRQHQYQTYGLFFDNYSQATVRNGNRAWGSVASSFAIAEDKDREGRPQLVFYASANSSFRFRDTGGFNTETIDARVGTHLTYEFSAEARACLGWMHQSGHATDEIEDRELFGSNLGNEIIYLRGIFDSEEKYRIGATLKFYFDSDPGMKTLGGDQFIEYMIGSVDESRFHLTPFVAFGVEEYGRSKYFTTVNIQVGVYSGSHFKDERKTNARLALGYYNGADPRLKYMEFKERETGFGYLGMFFDI